MEVKPIISKKHKKLEIYSEENPYRFFILGTFFMLTFANGLQWVSISSVASNFGIAYNMQSWKVNLFSLIFMIIYPFAFIPEAYIIDNISVKLGLYIASFCTLLGAALKCFTNKNMIWCWIGQFLAGFFQPAILDTVGKIPARWFNMNTRTTITTLLCLSDIIGILVGFVFFSFIIDPNLDMTVEEDIKEWKRQFEDYLFWEFILNLALDVPVFLVNKDFPSNPTSPSQAKMGNVPIMKGLVMLIKNKKFIYLLMATFFIVGYYDVYGTVLYSVLALYNIDDIHASQIYSVSSALGVIAAFLLSILLDITKKFKFYMTLMAILGTLFQLVYTILLEVSLTNDKIDPYLVGMIFYTLVSMIIIPFYTIGMNYACEITYPVGEALNGGLMMVMSQLTGIGGTFLCDYLINNSPRKWWTNVIMIFWFAAASIFCFFLDDKLERNDIEEFDATEKLPEITKYSVNL